VEIKAVTRLGRFKDIAITLFRYGFDDVVERLDLPGKVLLEKIRKVDREMSTWERIRHMLVDLGPTYIKFGQIMSLRPDLIPRPLILELRKLQDEVAPVKYQEIQEVVEKSLQRPLSEVFSFFDEEPSSFFLRDFDTCPSSRVSFFPFGDAFAPKGSFPVAKASLEKNPSLSTKS
jgi:ubiquinone biosynthesis protein